MSRSSIEELLAAGAGRLAVPVLCTLHAMAAAGAACAAPAAHEHGVARLDVMVEPTRLTLRLETPLDSLVGFERAPRDDAERRAVATALGQLRDGARLFAVDPAADCRFSRADLQVPAFLAGSRPAAAGPTAATGSHAEVEASYEFECRAGGQAAFVEARLFQPFGRLQRIDGQAVTPQAQRRFTLRRPAVRVELAR